MEKSEVKKKTKKKTEKMKTLNTWGSFYDGEQSFLREYL